MCFQPMGSYLGRTFAVVPIRIGTFTPDTLQWLAENSPMRAPGRKTCVELVPSVPSSSHALRPPRHQGGAADRSRPQPALTPGTARSEQRRVGPRTGLERTPIELTSVKA